jgi:hypothetical protein
MNTAFKCADNPKYVLDSGFFWKTKMAKPLEWSVIQDINKAKEEELRLGIETVLSKPKTQ